MIPDESRDIIRALDFTLDDMLSFSSGDVPHIFALWEEILVAIQSIFGFRYSYLWGSYLPLALSQHESIWSYLPCLALGTSMPQYALTKQVETSTKHHVESEIEKRIKFLFFGRN